MNISTSKQSAEARVQPPAGPYVRVAGHAGVWELDGPALVLTDDDCFEHPSLVNVHMVADPGRFAVVDAADLTPFTPIAVAEDQTAA